MGEESRNAWHLRRARLYAEQALRGLEAAGQEWSDDPVHRAGLTHLVEVCAEHMGNLPRDIQARYPDVPWKPMADYRIIAAHAYYQADPRIVEDIIRQHLPRLLPQIEELLKAGV